MNIKDNVEIVRGRIAQAQLRRGINIAVNIVAVTKTHPSATILEIRNAGIDMIGENRVQEAENKFQDISASISNLKKRLVGHLQSNKINVALNIFDTIDSVDSLKLANKIGSKAISINRTIPTLLEINTSGESAKFGFKPKNTDDILACFEVQGIEVQGLMTVGPFTSDIKEIRKAFISLRKLHTSLKNQINTKSGQFTELSMGMSDDFEIAVEEGATMVRLGTVLFGQRNNIL